MARNQNLTVRLLAGLLLAASATQVQAEGWFYNPFGGSGSKTTQVAKPAKKEPSTLQKMNQGTKNFFTSINPFGSSKPKTTASKPKKQKSDWNWWFQAPEDEPPQTVDDFLARPRPRF